jgi:hypothetical protein
LIKRSWRLQSIEVKGGDLQAPAIFHHEGVLSPENPSVVLIPSDDVASGPSVSAQFQKSNGELWSPLELESVEKAFRSCSRNYVQDRR